MRRHSYLSARPVESKRAQGTNETTNFEFKCDSSDLEPRFSFSRLPVIGRTQVRTFTQR